jgi:hypothetical protein
MRTFARRMHTGFAHRLHLGFVVGRLDPLSFPLLLKSNARSTPVPLDADGPPLHDRG